MASWWTRVTICVIDNFLCHGIMLWSKDYKFPSINPTMHGVSDNNSTSWMKHLGFLTQNHEFISSNLSIMPLIGHTSFNVIYRKNSIRNQLLSMSSYSTHDWSALIFDSNSNRDRRIVAIYLSLIRTEPCLHQFISHLLLLRRSVLHWRCRSGSFEWADYSDASRLESSMNFFQSEFRSLGRLEWPVAERVAEMVVWKVQILISS